MKDRHLELIEQLIIARSKSENIDFHDDLLEKIKSLFDDLSKIDKKTFLLSLLVFLLKIILERLSKKYDDKYSNKDATTEFFTDVNDKQPDDNKGRKSKNKK